MKNNKTKGLSLIILFIFILSISNSLSQINSNQDFEDEFLEDYDLKIPKRVQSKSYNIQSQIDSDNIQSRESENIQSSDNIQSRESDNIQSSENIQSSDNIQSRESENIHSQIQNIQSQTNKIQTQKINEKNKVIIILKEPEDVWRREELAKYEQEIHKIKDSMKNYATENSQIDIQQKFSTLNAFSAEITNEQYEELLLNPLVNRIEENFDVRKQITQTVKTIGAEKTWRYNIQGEFLTGKGQTICVIDTGIDYNHESLGNGWGNKILGGYNTLNSEALNCEMDNEDCIDRDSHGTHVAGIISANGNLKGIAPESNLFIIKALNDNGAGSISNVVRGIEKCIENRETYNITIIVMSLGTDSKFSNYCDTHYTTLATAINNATENNMKVLAATGNKGDKTEILSPACIKNVIAVGNANKEGTLITTNSNTWNNDMIVAPGQNILSTILNNNQGVKSGTSMATPHVAGIIALINQYYLINGEIKNSQEIFDLLNNTGKIIIQNVTYEQEFKFVQVNELINNLTNLAIKIETPENKIYNEENLLLNITHNNENAVITYLLGDESVVYSAALKPTNYTYGPNTLKAQISHNGNSNYDIVTFILDNINPNITIISPENKYYNTSSIAIEINVEDENGINNTWYELNDETYTYTNLIYVELNDGVHTITAWTEDMAGNLNNANITFIVDTTPPIITISNQNTTTNESVHLLEINAEDENGINKTWYQIYNDNNNDTNITQTNHTYTEPVLIELNEGENIITAWTEDMARNIAHDTIKIIIDTTQPNVEINSPEPKLYNNGTILINLSSNSNNTWYQINNVNETYIDPTLIDLEDGLHTLTAWTQTITGLNEKNVTFTIDTTPPSITIIQPSNNTNIQTTTPIIKLKVEDKISINTTCTIYLNNINKTIIIQNNTETNVETEIFNLENEQEYTYYFECQDNAGNTNKTNDLMFRVDIENSSSNSTPPPSSTSSSTPRPPTTPTSTPTPAPTIPASTNSSNEQEINTINEENNYETEIQESTGNSRINSLLLTNKTININNTTTSIDEVTEKKEINILPIIFGIIIVILTTSLIQQFRKL